MESITGYVGVSQTFLYTSYERNTGQTCSIRIVKVNDGSKSVDDAEMSELSALNSPGDYYYNYTPTATGAYKVQMFEGSFSDPTWSSEPILFTVLGADAQAASATYTTAAKVAALMGLRSGSSRLTFSTDTIPTLSEVNTLISQVQGEIDAYTGHAWRSVTVSNEVHDYIFPRAYGIYGYGKDNRCVKLNHRSIRDFSSDSGDKLEVWDGSEWVDFLSTYSEGKDEDFWCDYNAGMIYFRDEKPCFRDNSVKVTYRYGESSIPGDVETAATYLTAYRLLMGECGNNIISEGESFTVSDKVTQYYDKAYKILLRRLDL